MAEDVAALDEPAPAPAPASDESEAPAKAPKFDLPPALNEIDATEEIL